MIALTAVAFLLFIFGAACMWPVAYGAGYRRCDRDIGDIPHVDWSRDTWVEPRELSKPPAVDMPRMPAAALLAHLRAERGDAWTPTGEGGAHYKTWGTIAQRRHSRAAEQRLMHAAWNNPTWEEPVITDDEMRHLTDDWRDAIKQPIPVARIGDAT